MDIASSAFLSLCAGFLFGALRSHSRKTFFFLLTTLVAFFVVLSIAISAYNVETPPFDWVGTVVGVVASLIGMSAGQSAYEEAFGDRR